MSNFTDFVGGGGESFEGVDLSSAGATHTMDLSQGNYFIGGELTQSTTLAFSNVPQVAKWSYSAITKTGNFGYDISSATYDNLFVNLSGQDDTLYTIFFKTDGTKLYIVGDEFDRVYQYSLSTPWDINTISYDSVFDDVTSHPLGLYISPDGTNMYVSSYQNSGRLQRYVLSTPWDLSTSSFHSQINLTSQTSSVYGIAFKPDGTKFYAINHSGDTILEYNLSTPWDISTFSFSNNSFGVAAQESTPWGLGFNSTGSKMYVTGYTADRMFEYTLSTPWDISTTSYLGVSLNLSSRGPSPVDFFFKPGGNKLFVFESTNQRIHEYDTSLPASIDLPSSVEDTELLSLSLNKRINYEFSTVDGGANVQLLKQEVTP